MKDRLIYLAEAAAVLTLTVLAKDVSAIGPKQPNDCTPKHPVAESNLPQDAILPQQISLNGKTVELKNS